jgi:protein SCO1/2
MQSTYISNHFVALSKAGFLLRQSLGVLAISLMFVHGSAVAASDQEPEMDHMQHEHAMDHSMPGMDHSQHEMDHSMHEHQMSTKGKYTSMVASYTVPDIKLVDMNGVQISLTDALSSAEPVILNFIFTTCTTICPVMSSTFQQVQTKLGSKRSNARLISISIDPENDTPAKLKVYAAKYKAGPQWKFLTGTFDNSLLVQNAFGVFAGEKMNHKPVTFLKAKGSENQWVRLDGLINAPDVIKEFDKLNISEHKH